VVAIVFEPVFIPVVPLGREVLAVKDIIQLFVMSK